MLKFRGGHMFGKFMLYVDIVLEQASFKEVLQTVESKTKTFFPITNVSDTLELPKFQYDLLILSYEKYNPSVPLDELNHYYKKILMVGVPFNRDIKNQLLQEYVWIIFENYTTKDIQLKLESILRQEHLERTNAQLLNLVESVQNSIVVADKKGVIQYANPYFQKLSRYSLNELIGKKTTIVRSPLSKRTNFKELWETITKGDTWEGHFTNIDKEGNKFYEAATISPMVDSHNHIEKYVKISTNITRERTLLNELSSEVKIAHAVMRSFLPKPYQDHFLHFKYKTLSFNEIGGDFILFNSIENYKYFIALIDVMGHGASAAIYAVAISQMFRDYIDYMPLNEVVGNINDMLCDINDAEEKSARYVTGIFIEIDVHKNNMSIINCGHPDLVLHFSYGSNVYIPSNNILLGVMEHQKFNHVDIPLYDISKILMFTDGVYDNNNETIDEFLSKINNMLKKNLSEQELFHEIMDDKNVVDDATFTCIELKP